MNLNEKRQRIREMADEMQNLLDSGLTPQKRQRFDVLKNKVKEMRENLRRAEDFSDLSRELDRPDHEPSRPDPRDGFGGLERRSTTTATPGCHESRSYRSLFYGNPSTTLDKRGFESFGEFMRVLESGRADSRLEELRSMAGNVPADGGVFGP